MVLWSVMNAQRRSTSQVPPPKVLRYSDPLAAEVLRSSMRCAPMNGSASKSCQVGTQPGAGLYGEATMPPYKVGTYSQPSMIDGVSGRSEGL
jgi:hypothetical protein